MDRLIPISIAALLATLMGCSLLKSRGELPDKRQMVREQLTVHSDFYLPRHHRIVDNLVALRYDVTNTLEIPLSDEPIHVYLFENEKRFRDFVSRKLSGFPDRRAFFIKNNTTLTVIAFWGEKIVEDLRHEVTHGYVHSAVSNVPLWLDEGIAEFFEIENWRDGVNASHVRILAEAYRREQWRPDLNRLEEIRPTADLTQLEYAEAWLWVHFLLKTDAHANSLVGQTLKQLREFGTAPPLAPQIESWLPNWEQDLILHLKQLADNL